MNEFHDETGIYPLDLLAPRGDLIPGWMVWQSPSNKLWHGYKPGSQPRKRVDGESLEDLREAVNNA